MKSIFVLIIILTLLPAGIVSKYGMADEDAETNARMQGGGSVEQFLNVILKGKTPRGDIESAILALIDLADPNDAYGLKSASAQANLALAAPGLAAASLAALGDEQAIAWLLRIATGDRWSSPQAIDASLYASGLLRHLGNRQTQTAVEKTLEENPGLHGTLRQYLQALVASLKYRFDALRSEGDRAAYLAFERELWLSLALAPKGSASFKKAIIIAAQRTREKLGAIERQFLSRVLDEPASPLEEKSVVFQLIILQKEKSLIGKLKIIAASKSLDADQAVWVLKQLENKR